MCGRSSNQGRKRGDRHDRELFTQARLGLPEQITEGHLLDWGALAREQRSLGWRERVRQATALLPGGPCPVEEFGQETDHTCAVACLRCLLWHADGRVRQERDLIPGLIPEDRRGNTIKEVVQALDRLGFRTLARCLAGQEGCLGLGKRRPASLRVEEGTSPQLGAWLHGTVAAGRPVLACLDTRLLGGDHDPAWGGPHAVVVLKATDEVVLLDPDPPGPPSYPKSGRLEVVGPDAFLAAWDATWHIALEAWR
jgi:hypothetical protein